MLRRGENVVNIKDYEVIRRCSRLKRIDVDTMQSQSLDLQCLPPQSVEQKGNL